MVVGPKPLNPVAAPVAGVAPGKALGAALVCAPNMPPPADVAGAAADPKLKPPVGRVPATDVAAVDVGAEPNVRAELVAGVAAAPNAVVGAGPPTGVPNSVVPPADVAGIAPNAPGAAAPPNVGVALAVVPKGVAAVLVAGVPKENPVVGALVVAALPNEKPPPVPPVVVYESDCNRTDAG